MIEFIIFSLIWLILFLYSLFISRNDLLGTSFLVFQFVFIGLGIVIWPFIKGSAAHMFSTYDIASITFETAIKANSILLTGVCVAYITYQLLRQCIGFTNYPSYTHTQYFPNTKILCITFFFGVISTYFILTRIDLLIMVMTSSGIESVIALSEVRKEAVSSYFMTLVVYNIYPAATYACVIGYLVNKTKFWRNVMFISILLALLALFLVFQKRPLIIYLIGLFFIFKFFNQLKTNNRVIFDFYRTIIELKYIFVALFILLIGFYYLYTGHRLENDLFTSLMLNAEASFTRIFGRLSIPALMYTQYFPTFDDHYLVSNVGIFSKIGNYELYKDTEVVATHFSLVGGQGTLASSVFFDFYGGFGFPGVIIGGFIVGMLLFVGQLLMNIKQASFWRVFLASVLMINIFYLSQASVFRSMAGYGGGIYIVVWFIFRTKYILFKKNIIKKVIIKDNKRTFNE